MFLARIAVFVCLGSVSTLAQTPGIFIPGKTLPAAQLNSALGAKVDWPTTPSTVPGVGGVTISGTPAAGYVPIGTGPTGAVWGAFPQAIYVDYYGAVGNGVTDDTPAFTNALAACALTSGTVAIGPKRYLINSASITIPPNCRLVGNFYPGAQRNRDFSTVPYAILLNPSFTINMGNGGQAGGSELSGVFVLASNMVPVSTVRGGINLVAGFSGTGITIKGSDAHVIDTTVLGFTNAISSSGFGRLVVDRVYFDAFNGVSIDNCHDTCRITDTQGTYYTTANIPGGSTLQYAVSGIAANGSGLYRVTIPANILVTGDVINIGQANINAVNGRWTVTVIDTTHVDLQGSTSGGPTVNSNTTAGQNWITVASTANIGTGQTITGTGIPGSTTVTAVWQNQNIVWLSNAATATGSSVSLAFADPAYTSGGTLVLTANARRGGKSYSVTNTEGVQMTNVVGGQGPDTAFYFGTGAGWIHCVNCAADSNTVTNSNGADPLQVGVWFDGTSYGCYWMGSVAADDIAFRSTSSGPIANEVVNGNLGTTNLTIDPFAATMEIAGSNRLIATGNQATNSVANVLLADAAGSLTFSNNDFGNDTAYFQTYAGLNDVVGSGNKFASGTLIPFTPPVMGSWIVNGDFAIDQAHEGSSAANCPMLPDRWRCTSNNGGAFTIQRVADAPAGYEYSSKITSAASQTIGATTINRYSQQLESTMLQNLNWGTATALPVAFDFCAKSSLTGSFTVTLRNGGSSPTYLVPYAIPSANVWVCFSQIVPGPTTGVWVGGAGSMNLFLDFDLGTGSNQQSANANAWQASTFQEITGSVQLGATSGATLNIAAVHLRQGTQTSAPYVPNLYEAELARARRFYRKSFPLGTAPVQNAGVAGARCVTNPIANGRPSQFVPFDPPMETNPTVTTYNPSAANANWRDVTAAADVTVTVDPATAKSSTGVNISTGATVTTLADELCIHYTADTGN
jgi:hypothetical protein